MRPFSFHPTRFNKTRQVGQCTESAYYFIRNLLHKIAFILHRFNTTPTHRCLTGSTSAVSDESIAIHQYSYMKAPQSLSCQRVYITSSWLLHRILRQRMHLTRQMISWKWKNFMKQNTTLWRYCKNSLHNERNLCYPFSSLVLSSTRALLFFHGQIFLPHIQRALWQESYLSVVYGLPASLCP